MLTQTKNVGQSHDHGLSSSSTHLLLPHRLLLPPLSLHTRRSDNNQIAFQTTTFLTSPLLLSIPKRHITTYSLPRGQKASRPPDSPPPCSHHVLHHEFAFTYGKPPVLSNYTLPSHCPSRDFSKIVLEFKSTCRGRQFDRIFGVWLDGVELLRSCTAEPRPNGIVWSVHKDVTRYHSLLVKNETQILAVYLGNLVDKTYTGVYHVDVIFHYYPSSRHHISPPQADMILPVSRNLPLNDGCGLRSRVRMVLVTRNSPGNGPFREVVVTLDGVVAGAVWPFPVVFTGGINPLLWRPITAIGSFDLPSYDIEVTPFLGSLLDGEGHKVEFSVTNALNVWYVDANLHLWLDKEKEVVEGKVLEVGGRSLEISYVSDFKGLNGNFTTKAKRSVRSIGLVKSSHGDIITNASQEFTYVNKMVLGKDGNFQIIDQLIQADDSVHAKRESREIYVARSIKSFPFYLYSDYLEGQNHTSQEVANVTMGFNEERSWSDDGSMRMFKSKVENKQEAQGVMVVKNNLVVSGYGGTQQVYNYVGSDQCYFRNISSFNYTILYDKVETVCKKKTLKLPPQV
ncbi:Peptide-N4-(N-acetyl-beta-glucosaminyl)asparagine amidase A protein [Raphanus sativus]|nr:Peptide-N4-(N-acetyl-beta-glucosaminyl)asparagine amidase A protein [Raphanus sativus]